MPLIILVLNDVSCFERNHYHDDNGRDNLYNINWTTTLTTTEPFTAKTSSSSLSEQILQQKHVRNHFKKEDDEPKAHLHHFQQQLSSFSIENVITSLEHESKKSIEDVSPSTAIFSSSSTTGTGRAYAPVTSLSFSKNTSKAQLHQHQRKALMPNSNNKTVRRIGSHHLKKRETRHHHNHEKSKIYLNSRGMALLLPFESIYCIPKTKRRSLSLSLFPFTRLVSSQVEYIYTHHHLLSRRDEESLSCRAGSHRFREGSIRLKDKMECGSRIGSQRHHSEYIIMASGRKATGGKQYHDKREEGVLKLCSLFVRHVSL